MIKHIFIAVNSEPTFCFHRQMELTPWPRKVHRWQVKNDSCMLLNMIVIEKENYWLSIPFVQTCQHCSIVVSPRAASSTENYLQAFFSLAEKGIKLVQEGQYAQAVAMFTEAIKCDPKDNRFFGNRSYCYYCLEQYPQALADAERSIQLAPDWPKGHFRQGSALMGMKVGTCYCGKRI